MKKGWTATVWVDVPEDWDAHDVAYELKRIMRGSVITELKLNTVHTPKPEKKT